MTTTVMHVDWHHVQEWENRDVREAVLALHREGIAATADAEGLLVDWHTVRVTVRPAWWATAKLPDGAELVGCRDSDPCDGTPNTHVLVQMTVAALPRPVPR